MRIIKAYAEAAGLATSGFGSGKRAAYDTVRETRKESIGGDSVSLSSEARQRLASHDSGALSICPQDAMYDQYGHVTRQFDSLQNELRKLAAKFSFSAENPGMAAKISALQSRVATLRAEV